MLSLRDLQQRFAEALVDGDDSAIRTHVHDGVIGAAARLGIYRNNVQVAFTKALALGFPVIERLTGADYFRQLALDYLREHPSRSGNLQHIGGPFPAYLRQRFANTEYGYLPDVAALEWARDEALLADDVAPLTADAFRGFDPVLYEQLRLDLHPACALIRSPFPIVRIWCANQPGATEETIDLASGGSTTLVARGRDGVEFYELGAAAFRMLEVLGDRGTLGSALDAARSVDEQFDVTATLRLAFEAGAFAALHAPAPPCNDGAPAPFSAG